MLNSSLPCHINGREFVALELFICRFAFPVNGDPEVVDASWLVDMARCEGPTSCWNYYHYLLKTSLYFFGDVQEPRFRDRQTKALRSITGSLSMAGHRFLQLNFPYPQYRRFWDSGYIPENWRPYLAIGPSPGGGGE